VLRTFNYSSVNTKPTIKNKPVNFLLRLNDKDNTEFLAVFSDSSIFHFNA
jgi:hypothetical protein